MQSPQIPAVDHQHNPAPSKPSLRLVPPPSKPPIRRGRRGHPAIGDVPGLERWMELQFQQVPRPAFREIERRLRQDPIWDVVMKSGYHTGRSAIHAYWKKWSARGRPRKWALLIPHPRYRPPRRPLSSLDF